MRGQDLTAPHSRGTNPTRVIGWLVLALAAVALVSLGESLRDRPRHDPALALDPATLRAGYGPATYDAALEAADTQIAGQRTLLASNPGSWLRMEALGRALLARARLSARPEDLAEANSVLDQAVAAAPWPAGPMLSRAGAALAVHDLAAVERALARLDASNGGLTAAEMQEERALRCEVAFERSDLPKAEKLCSSGSDLGFVLRQANMAVSQARIGEAAALVDRALQVQGQSPAQLAGLMLQRGSIALAVGDWKEAERWARAADRAFPGYWLTRAYLAQSQALQGRLAEARSAYEALARTTGNPDVMDALSGVLASQGERSGASEWSQRAAQEWAHRSSLLPETYATHRAENFVQLGNTSGATRLAAADFARRPFPATAVHYAYALLADNRPADSLAVVRKTLERGFLTADLKLMEARTLASLGRAGEAAAALAEARVINPRIDHPRQALIRFRQE